jgi:hypothetical protein
VTSHTLPSSNTTRLRNEKWLTSGNCSPNACASRDMTPPSRRGTRVPAPFRCHLPITGATIRKTLNPSSRPRILEELSLLTLCVTASELTYLRKYGGLSPRNHRLCTCARTHSCTCTCTNRQRRWGCISPISGIHYL